MVHISSSVSIRGYGRLGSACSLLDYCSLGSSLSVRSFVRIGSSLSVSTLIASGNGIRCPSLSDYVNFSSSMSLRAFARLGKSYSSVTFGSLASSLSIRHVIRIGSAVSILGPKCNKKGTSIGRGNLSVINTVYMSSSLSVRSAVLLATGGTNRNSCSAFDFMTMGSALSMRNFMRIGNFVSMREKDSSGNRFVAGQASFYHYAQLGSSLSVRSFIRSGSACSILRFTHFGSTVSLRSFSRAGEAVSTMDFVNVGSSVSIRSFVRLGSTLSAFGNSLLRIGTGYIFCDSSNDIKFYAATTKQSMTLTSSGGYQGKLHGTWEFETSFTTSDRRLKTDVEPLVKSMMRYSRSSQVHASSYNDHISYHDRKKSLFINHVIDDTQGHSYDEVGSALGIPNRQKLGSATSYDESGYLPVVVSLMRQLRPVSFRYKNNAESKHSRYGFIAQELENLIPSVIYSDGSSGLKFIRYHDLLAIVTMGMQGIDLTVANIEQKVSDVNTKIVSDFGLLSPRVRVFEDALVELLKSSLGNHATGDGEGSETRHLRDGGTLTDL